MSQEYDVAAMVILFFHGGNKQIYGECGQVVQPIETILYSCTPLILGCINNQLNF